MPKKKNPFGPTGPQAGIPRRMAQAAAWHIDPAILPAVLDRHRRGSESARRLLLTGFERIVWQAALKRGKPCDWLITDLWFGLRDAIDELRANSVPAHGVEPFIRWKIKRSVPPWDTSRVARQCWDETPWAITPRPPRQTNDYRRTRNLPCYEGMTRSHFLDTRGNGKLVALDPTTPEKDRQKMLAEPKSDNVDLRIDVRAAIDRGSPLARRIAITITDPNRDRVSKRELATELGVSRYQIDVELASLATELQDYSEGH